MANIKDFMVMVIFGWTTLTSHDDAQNDHIRQHFCQIRAWKKMWSTPFSRFVYFTRHRHVTGVKNQSNCIIPKMCGRPDFPSLLLFGHLDQKTVVQLVFRQFWKPDGPHFFFMPLFGKSVALYGHFARHCVTSDWVHLHTIISFSIHYILNIITNKKLHFFLFKWNMKQNRTLNVTFSCW